MVLAVGHGHPVGGLPVHAEDAWASFLASGVLAEAGAGGGRGVDGGAKLFDLTIDRKSS